MHVYSYCNALSARFFAADRALNSYFMIMIMIMDKTSKCDKRTDRQMDRYADAITALHTVSNVDKL